MSPIRPAPGPPTRAELEIRRSRFLTLIARADGEGAARAVIAAARGEFPDARHHCSAFIVSVPGANRIERSSDDGEPAGTAGMPMLEALRGSGMEDVVAVVVRYFGGIKLGTGGLVRAYGEAVTTALPQVPRVRVVRRSLLRLELPHAEAGRVEAELRARGADVAGTEFGAGGVVLTLATGDTAALEDLIASLTSAAYSPEPAGEQAIEERLR